MISEISTADRRIRYKVLHELLPMPHILDGFRNSDFHGVIIEDSSIWIRNRPFAAIIAIGD